MQFWIKFFHQKQRQSRWKIYNSILEKYVNFCHQELISKKYPDILEYLNNRKITQKEITYFKIGYSPNKKDFYEKLKKDFNEKQINSSGIYYLDEKNKLYVDRFRNRIIFPVYSINDSVLAIGARALSKTSYAKYLNSPETEFYKKGNNLYNINSAKKLRNKNEEIFVVEGYMDAVTLHKFGFENVAANLGTAMTERQLNLIWNFFKKPIICLDGDSSGKKAAIRAAERLFPHMKADYNIYFLTLPENLDPDSYINKKGRESFLKFSESKIEIQDFIWESYYQDLNKSDPHSLTLFERKIRSICSEVNDKTLGKYFLDNFIKKINELTPNINITKNNFLKLKRKTNPLQQTKDIYALRNKFTEKELKEFSVLFLVINNLDIFRKNIELISKMNFSNKIISEFKEKLINYLLSEKFFERKKVEVEDFDKKFNEIIKAINTNAPVKEICQNKNEEEIIVIFDEIVEEIKKIELQEKIEFLEDKVSLNLDENLYSELLSLRNQLKRG